MSGRLHGDRIQALREGRTSPRSSAPCRACRPRMACALPGGTARLSASTLRPFSQPCDGASADPAGSAGSADRGRAPSRRAPTSPAWHLSALMIASGRPEITAYHTFSEAIYFTGTSRFRTPADRGRGGGAPPGVHGDRVQALRHEATPARPDPQRPPHLTCGPGQALGGTHLNGSGRLTVHHYRPLGYTGLS